MSDDPLFHLSVQVPKNTKARPYKPFNNCVETVGLSKIQQRVFLWVLASISICCVL